MIHQTQRAFIRIFDQVSSFIWLAPPNGKPLACYGTTDLLKVGYFKLNYGHQADTLDRKFEKPLRQHLENYRTVVHVSHYTYSYNNF